MSDQPWVRDVHGNILVLTSKKIYNVCSIINNAYNYEWIPKKFHWLSQFLQVYIGPIQSINQCRFIGNLVANIPSTLVHEIHIKGCVVKDAFATFDTTLKPNSLISIGPWWPN